MVIQTPIYYIGFPIWLRFGESRPHFILTHSAYHQIMACMDSNLVTIYNNAPTFELKSGNFLVHKLQKTSAVFTCCTEGQLLYLTQILGKRRIFRIK
jgi:hypothetical protein